MYVPFNVEIYLSALSGALVTLAAPDMTGLDTGSNGTIAEIADAFAQAVDGRWQAIVGVPPSSVALSTLQKSCETVWLRRSRLESSIAFNPKAYMGIATGIVALARTAHDQTVSQGVDPDGDSSEGSWIDLPAGETIDVPVTARTIFYAADASGAQAGLQAPDNPADGQEVVLKVATAVLAAVLFTPGAGQVAEDPQNPGSFSNVGEAVSLVEAGQLFGWKYQKGKTRWLQSR